MLKNLRSKLRYKPFVLTVAITCFLNCALATEIARSQDLNKRISIDVEKKTLKETLDEISKQVHVGIIYSNAKGILKNPVTIHAKDQPVGKVLTDLLSPLTLTYEIIGDQIVVKFDNTSSRPPTQGQSDKQRFPIRGKVTDGNGSPLPGATVKILNEPLTTITDKDGNFSFDNAPDNGILSVSFIGFQTANFNYATNNKDLIAIVLKADASALNEVQVIGYGTTTKRLNTGSVSTITEKDIQEQPITNVLSALSGRMPGVFVQTTNGLPGGNVSIQIRGKGSINAGTDPLYIVDGVPFVTSVGTLNSSTSLLGQSSINGSVSPFNSLNPDDIESINILKDADATAIYGSRGSNGVVLITTKKGKAGATKVDFKLSQGVTQAANLPKLLNLQQYLQVRKEAFANDGLTPSADPTSPNYAPELKVWSQSQSTDWGKFLLGGTGDITDGQTSISGGDEQTSFVAGANYHSESTILPGNNLYSRGGIHSSFQHNSLNKKLSFQLSNSITLDNNVLANPTYNLLGDLLMPPNYPVYDASGNLNWSAINPYGEVKATSKSNSYNILVNSLISYSIKPNLMVKISAGYTDIGLDQTQLFPSASLYPTVTNYTNFGKNRSRAYLIEPQVSYIHHFNSSSISFLAGGTYQNSIANGEQIVASNFTNADLMENLSSAGTYSLSNNVTQYKYESIFGRITYNLNDTYIANFSIRRDGSSKFGPGNQFGTFAAIGGAWIFTNESFFKKGNTLSYGKLRASYGTTGNDQISPYQYLSTYGNGYVYQGISGLKPTRISNSNFHWETTAKLEVALELGFFKNRILLDIDRYQNRSRDQLISYTLPTLAGFSSYQSNLPGVVENSGWEIDFTSKNIQKKDFSWATTFNLTLPKNKLLSFKNLATSSYSQTLAIGEPITRIYGYKFSGIDPQTGTAMYYTATGGTTANPSSTTDAYMTIGSGMPILYGGFGNSFKMKNWELNVFAQFSRQYAMGSLGYTPGNQVYNNYLYVYNRWQQPGEITNVPKSSTNYDFNYVYSSANYFDASYIRLKTIALSYQIKGKWLVKSKINQLRIFAQAENILTLWHSSLPFLDPESGSLTAISRNIPPLKTITAGIQTSF